jgi:hypothetical protein
MPAPDPRFPQAASGADDWFRYPDVTPLAGRLAPGDELDEAAADALANAIAAIAARRGRAAVAAASAPPTTPRLPDRVASTRRGGGERTAAPSPLRTAGGWRNG